MEYKSNNLTVLQINNITRHEGLGEEKNYYTGIPESLWVYLSKCVIPREGASPFLFLKDPWRETQQEQPLWGQDPQSKSLLLDSLCIHRWPEEWSLKPSPTPGDAGIIISDWGVHTWASLLAQSVENLPAMWETRVWSLGREDPLEKGMAYI